MTAIPVNEIIQHATSGDWSLFQQQPTLDSDTTVEILCARLDTTNNGGSGIVEADIQNALAQIVHGGNRGVNVSAFTPRYLFKGDDFTQGAITAACVCYAESRGDPAARNVNGPDSSAPGSIDRGLFQFNNQAWPKITDAMAYNPRIAFLLAWRITDGWQDWATWHGSKGLDRNSDESKVVVAEWENMTGRATPEALGTGLVGGLMDWAKSLGAILSHLLQPEWWKRIGVGAVGLLLIVAALVLIGYTAYTKAT